jgi:hypothetical protein
MLLGLLKKPLILSLLALCMPFSVLMAQSGFDKNDYQQFILDNKDLQARELIDRFAPREPFYSAINLPDGLSSFAYLDSIKEKFSLTADELRLLEKNYFVVSERLSFDKITPALDDIFQKDLPVFVSTDAILHALHISYGNLLRDIEMQQLKPQLEKIVDGLYNGFPDLVAEYGGNEALLKSLADADLYITIAKSLMDESLARPQYADEDEVMKVWDAIQSEEFISMPLFTDINRLLDFSQFKVRGHYARYEELQSYFKCMMWLGRMEFVLADAPKEWYEEGFDREGLRRLNITALMINKLLETRNILGSLDEIDRIIGFMVGESDNLRPTEYSALLAGMGIGGPLFLLNEDNFDNYLQGLKNSEDSGQKILGGYMKGNPETMEPTQLPVSYRLLGQRFIIDSYIFYKLVYDNIVFQGRKVCRMMPDPLDAMFALGNDNALPLLEEELETWNYSAQLAGLRYLIDAYDNNFWDQSLYNSWLQAVRLLNPDGNYEGKPLFMGTVAWQQEKLNTQLASWAQLRHDNLLYAKQSYTHGGECMFPYSYVEPYPDFYGQIADFAAMALSFDAFTNIHGYTTYQSVYDYFANLQSSMLYLEEISRKELAGESLNADEIEFLGDMLIEGNVSGPEFNGWYVDLLYDSDGGPRWISDPSESDFVIADVHTQPTDCGGNVVGNILHAGTGKVNLGIFLANCPSEDSKPMAFVGPVMSFYQLVTGDFERMTDEEWTKMIQGGLAPKRPDWVNIYLTDVNGSEYEKGRELDGIVYTGIPDYQVLNGSGIDEVYPNPFSHTLGVSLHLDDNRKMTGKGSEFEIALYTSAGRKSRVLAKDSRAPGVYNIEFDCSDLKPGMYFLVMRYGGLSVSRKLVKTR